MKSNSNAESVTAYSLYSKQAKERKKINPLEELYPTLPNKKYQDLCRSSMGLRRKDAV